MTNAWIHHRRVTIRRPNASSPAQFGQVGQYGGVQPTNEAVIAADLPASIQYDRMGRTPDADLPSAPTGRSTWKIFIPADVAAKGTILRGDTVVDDLGERYVVNAPEWGRFGHQLRADKLTV